jgi:hypothetical protein
MRGSDRASVKVDGREMADGFIPLVRDGGIRHVDIVMAEPRLDISSVEDMSGTNALALLQ